MTLFERIIAAPAVEAARREWQAADDAAAAADRRTEWAARAIVGAFWLALIGGVAWLM